GIRALYRLENRWQAWLDVEAALARAQEELRIIPTGTADAIGRAASLELLDRARIDEGFARTGHTIVPLVWELSRVTGEPYGGRRRPGSLSRCSAAAPVPLPRSARRARRCRRRWASISAWRRCGCRRARSAIISPRTSASSVSSPRPAARSRARSTP